MARLIQYGIKFLEGHTAIYPDRKTAEAAVSRMKSWPTTRFVQLVSRDVQYGEWS